MSATPLRCVALVAALAASACGELDPAPADPSRLAAPDDARSSTRLDAHTPTDVENDAPDVYAAAEVRDTEDSSAPETTAPAARAPAAVCGDATAASTWPCDDGNDCIGDGCHGSAREPSFALSTLSLSARAGVDHDDADGDGNDATGGDPTLRELEPFTIVLDALLADAIARDRLVPLVTLAEAETDGATDARVVVHRGLLPCDAADAHQSEGHELQVLSDRRAFPACAPTATFQATPWSAAPDHRPTLTATAVHAVLDLGPAGSLHLEDARVTLEWDERDGAALSGTIDGVLPLAHAGALRASPDGCWSVLDALAGVGLQPDHDSDGDGHLDRLLLAPSGPAPRCARDLVLGCCQDGDCDAGLVAGPDCVADPRIRDGFSIGLAFTGRPALVVGQRDGPCPDIPATVERQTTVVESLQVGFTWDDVATNRRGQVALGLTRAASDDPEQVDIGFAYGTLGLQHENPFESIACLTLATAGVLRYPEPLLRLYEEPAGRWRLTGLLWVRGCRPEPSTLLPVDLTFSMSLTEEHASALEGQPLGLPENHLDRYERRSRYRIVGISGAIGPLESNGAAPYVLTYGTAERIRTATTWTCNRRLTCDEIDPCQAHRDDGCNRELGCGDVCTSETPP